MTKYPLRGFPQFYLTAAAPCPYLPGRMERKIFTPLDAGDPADLHDHLTHQGFRRSQNIVYKPACEGCQACVSIRVDALNFETTKSFRRVVNRNGDLTAAALPPVASHEQFALMRSYLDGRHQDGGMADMTGFDYAAMVEETTVNTRIIEYRALPSAQASAKDAAKAQAKTKGPLLAVALTDVLEDGLSMVYSFFDVGEEERSLGTYMILEHIERARALDLRYVYLGYWVDECRKMAYKRRFKPQEMLTDRGWAKAED